MNNIMNKTINSYDDMIMFGRNLGACLSDGCVIELIGDVGAGKTTLTKGIALGLDINEDIQSPSFTISRVYNARDDLHLCHYDFYRLNDAGLMNDELSEAISDKHNVVIIEWSGAVENALPADRIVVTIKMESELSRNLTIDAFGPNSQNILDLIK